MRPWFVSDNVQPLQLEVGKVLASIFGDVSKLVFLSLLVCICGGMALKVVATYSVVASRGSLKYLLLKCENFRVFCHASEVLVHVVAIGALAKDYVADGSCGSCCCWSFGRGFSGGSGEAAGSLEESWMVACLQQSGFRKVAKWQLTFVGAVNGFMQQLLDFGSLMNLVPATAFW
jgi:hypothetical protein